MIKYLKKGLVIAGLVIILINTLACNNRHNNSAEINDANNGNELSYNKTKTLVENIDILNEVLEKKYGKSFKLVTLEDYEKAEATDWTLILKDNKVGIDTSTWKFNYNPDSQDSKYMDAILTTFTFLCGEEMGNSLWQLTGDLLEGGADETLYGFVHSGSQVTYKNGNIASYESGISQNTIYVWLTPSEY